MPGNILNADTMFPSFRESETSEQKLDKVTNYLYMLLEQLRYSLNNLDADNFNDTGLREIGEGIARPLQTSFANEFAKTNALIEGISDEFGSQIRLLTDWVGTDTDGNLISSAASITAAANKNKTDIALLTKRVEGDEAALAEYKISVGNTYATASSLTTLQNSVNKSLTTINQTASDQGALIELVAYYETDEDGNEVPVLNSTSIAAGVSEDEDFINLIASKVNVTGFVTFTSLENDGEGAATVNGNNLSLISDSNGDSMSSLTFYYQDNKGNPDYEMGNISTLYDEVNDVYTLGITGKFFKRTGSGMAATRLFLNGEGGVNIISAGDNITVSSAYGTSIYGQSYCEIGGIYYGVRIHAPNDYLDTINSNPGPNKFIFCNNGIFFIDENEDPHVVWER